MSGGLSLEAEDVKQVILNFALQIQRQIPAHLQRKKKRIIVLAGPTGSGKSALAMELAQAIDGEIVSADSMQVYRGMDIGTAKASRQDRLLIPHHLIDIRDIHESFNVVDFYYEARHACQQIIERGQVPIVVGGSGFYLHALLYGPPSGPPSIPEVRQALEKEIDLLGSEALYERLKQLDPHYARSITRNDKQKIVRALEIMTLTNKKVSKLSWKGRRQPQNYDFRCWFLYRPKEELYARLEERCEAMLREGFLEEVARLDEQGIRSNSSASQAIGYREALDFLLTGRTPEDYEGFVKAFKQDTRRYAKRQLTWFRKEPLFTWLEKKDGSQQAFDLIKRDYESLQ